MSGPVKQDTEPNTMVKVSVIVCCYNGEDTVNRAVDSALTQPMASSRHEVIVVDDGSSDGTPDVLSTYASQHSNLRYVRSEVNRGLVEACNLGLDLAQGRYVIRLDADDTFEPLILDTLVRPLDEDRADLVYPDRYEVMVATGQVQYVSLERFNLFTLTAAGVMMRRDLLAELGGYRPFFWEEYDLYMRYAQRSRRPFFHVPQALYRYNRRPDSMTMSRSGESERLGWQELKAAWGVEALRNFGWDPAVLEV